MKPIRVGVDLAKNVFQKVVAALLAAMYKMPDARLPEGKFMAVNHGLRTPRERRASAEYLNPLRCSRPNDRTDFALRAAAICFFFSSHGEWLPIFARGRDGSIVTVRASGKLTLATLLSLGQASIIDACPGRGMNNRRKLVIAFGASALVPSLTSIAQLQTKVWRVGFLGAGARPTAEHPDANIDAFILGMLELGYVEGKNLSVEWEFAQGKYDRLPALALRLVQSRVEVLVTYGTAAAQALRAATNSVPIVVAASIDPVGSGIAASLAHPGGNITGLSAIAVDLSRKHLELLAEIIPKLSRVAVLVNPGNSSHPVLLKNVQAAGKALNISILSTHASASNDIEQAFAAARRDGAGAVIVAGDALFAGSGQHIAAAAANNRMPSIGIYRDHVAWGTLMSYGQNIAEFHRRAATYVDKIFKGAKPGDLPVEQPMTIGLFINGKTAKALGLAIPRSLLISADKVIG